MQALFLISLGATCLGGAIALGALFHRFSHRPAHERVKTNDVGVKLDELDRRERAFNAMCERIGDELDAKRQTLEALTLRANEAAEALGRALDSVSFTFGSNSTRFRSSENYCACESAAPFELNDLSSRLEPTRRDDLGLRERRAKAA